jgi:hypothetical protein
MAEIIRNLEFVNKSRKMFVSIIEEYNRENNAELALDDFETICWIRIIHNEVEIPAMIEHFMWALNQNYDEEITEIPEDKKDISLCLLRYYKCIHNKRAKISTEKLKSIVKKLNLTNDAIAFLIKKHILEIEEGNKIYLWGIEHYPEILNDEIAASLWLLEKNESNLRGSFFRYYSLIRKSHIKLNDLSKYLTPNDYLALFLQAVEYLKNEADLQNSEQEAAKIWFDHDRFSHYNIWKDIPILNFSATDTYELLKIIDKNSEFWRLEDAIYMQKTRVFCYSLLSFIIKYELPDNNYHFTLRILKDVSRPSLIFEALFIIKRAFPEIIPWFLGDLNLAPIAMDIIDEFELNSNYYTNNSWLDNKFGKELSIKNTIWLEAINTILLNITDIWHSSISDKRQIGKTLALIYLNLSKKIFSLHLTVNPNGISHLEKLSERYSESLNLLQSLKTNPGNFYNASSNSQSLFPFVFQYCIAYIIDRIEKLSILDENSLNFYFEYYDVSIDFIRVVDNLYTAEIISPKIRGENENLENKVIEVLFKNLCSYLKFDIDDAVPSKGYWFGFYIENLDYIDWGYFFVLLYKYDFFTKLDIEFSSSIKVDGTSNKYTDRNHNQLGKVRLLFRVIYLGYLSLKSMRTDIYASGINIADVCNSLENFTIKYTGFYSVDNFNEKRFDAFDDFPSVVAIEKKGKSLLELFLNCLNHMKTTVQAELIKGIFLNSIKLERMLAAINIIEDITIKNIISEFIKNIDVEKFVDSCFMITNIEEAVFQALYSEQYWQIAESLISRIKKHYGERKFKGDREHYLIFQADLLLALRKKDLVAIQAVEFPTKTYLPREYKISELKQFFIALHKIDNEKNYAQAINMLKDLLSSGSQNIDYAITLFRASIFESLSCPNISLDSVNTSYNNWINFTNGLGEKKEDILARNRNVINFCSVPYYILNNKIIEFDNAMPYLTNEHKFHELIMSLVYNFYRERNLDHIAYDYMNDAKNYYIRVNKEIPSLLDRVLSNPGDQQLSNLRNSFKTIISTHYKSVPRIVPDNINNRNEINNFILDELFQALNQMLTKKQTIKCLEKEDDFTDILQSILKLRFPFYGWSIHDHPHYGISKKGLGPGEPDIVIESSAKPITIIEALILCGKNKKATHSHIEKCFKYSSSLERYYIIIYYKGRESKLDKTWGAYISDFNSYLFDKGKERIGEFIILNDKFDNANSFKIAKTCHTNFEIFHVMVNFSST